MTVFALPRHYRRALDTVAILVPQPDREGWRRLWHAELWHAAHQRSAHPSRNHVLALDLVLGLISDAAWLRADSLRLRFQGSPLLCLSGLTALCILAAAFAFHLSDFNARQLFLANLSQQFRDRFLGSAVIAIVAQFALPREGRAPAPPVAAWSRAGLLRVIQRSAFLTAKLLLIAALAFLLGVDLLEPFHGIYRFAFPQIYFTAVLLTIGLRWAALDQKRRCQQCLHALTGPARVGRPSHNFLEWNGTERACRHGHGALHQPEMQTSWLESNRWVVS